MSRFKLLFDRLEQLLTERINELREERIAEKKPIEVLASCTQNEAARKALLLELPSALYACLNREYGHTTAAIVIRTLSDLANVVFADAHPKYKAKPLAKPKLANLFGQYKRFFVEQFNLNSLLVVERLQSANYYTQVFSINMLVRQLIQVSTESYMVKLKKVVDQAKKEDPLPIRPTTVEEEVVEELCEEPSEAIDQKLGTASTKQSKSMALYSDRKQSRSLAQSISYKKEQPRQQQKRSRKDLLIEEEQLSGEGALVLNSLPKQLSVAPQRRLSMIKAIEPRTRILRPLKIDQNRPAHSQSVGKPFQKERAVSTIDRKLQFLDELYSPLILDPRSVRELATLDQRHIRAQLKSNSRYLQYFRPSGRSTPGGSMLPY